MLSSKQHKFKPSKANSKRKEKVIDDSGNLVAKTNNKRFPIVSLPEIPVNVRIQSYRRFIATASVSGTINISDCLNQFMISTTAIALKPYIKAFRIKKVRILAPVTTQGTSVTVSMFPLGVDGTGNSFNSVPETFLDTSASIDIPAYLALSPTLDTPFGSWHYNTTVDAGLVNITAPSGSTMDILFEYILIASVSGAGAYSRTVAGATAGTMYSAAVLTSFNPVGVNVI